MPGSRKIKDVYVCLFVCLSLISCCVEQNDKHTHKLIKVLFFILRKSLGGTLGIEEQRVGFSHIISSTPSRGQQRHTTTHLWSRSGQ